MKWENLRWTVMRVGEIGGMYGSYDSYVVEENSEVILYTVYAPERPDVRFEGE
jgi:hypothetical protein